MKDSDEILLSPPMMFREMGYKTSKPIYDGISELLDVDAIFRKHMGAPYYFINTNYFFYGNRKNLPYVKARLNNVQRMNEEK